MFARLCTPLEPERLHGGWRMQEAQRQAALLRAAARPPPRSALRHLLHWGTGEATAARVVDHMDDLIQDGECTHPMVHRLGGLQPTRAARGFLQLLGEECGFDALIRVVPGNLVKAVSLPSLIIRFFTTRSH